MRTEHRSRFPLAALLLSLAFLAWASGPASPAPVGTSGTAQTATDDEGLSALSDVTREWGRGIEAVIEKAYRECFHTYLVDGRILTLRLPFAQNKERAELTDDELAVSGGGKASPKDLWAGIGPILASTDFASYLAALSDGHEKLVIFDLPTKSWSTSTNRFAIERMLAGFYPGLPYRPIVLSPSRGATQADIYNYLYCVGRLGIDCSGFVWHILRSVAAADGLDLDRLLGRDVGLSAGRQPALYVGTWYYDPGRGRTRQVPDAIGDLLPGDIILFRGDDGSFIHSCVVQSVDLVSGTLRYLQSTDESPAEERGVHDSLILFDPGRPGTSLRDPSLRWLQKRGSAFPGEPEPFYLDDGERYRAYSNLGGGIVVRLKALERSVARLRARR